MRISFSKLIQVLKLSSLSSHIFDKLLQIWPSGNVASEIDENVEVMFRVCEKSAFRGGLCVLFETLFHTSQKTTVLVALSTAHSA